MNRTIQPDDRISHYRVVGPLGSGGMGEVYLAHDQKLERSVALKVLPFNLVRDEERVRRFIREAKSASSLNHPNIVTIYEIGHEQVHAAGDEEPDSDPIHFISMELVTGETLGDTIRSQKIDLKTLLGYLTQAAEGVAKAHGAGIVHRDLKPSNIMVSQDGYAKVLDFGLAKLVERQPTSGGASVATVSLHGTESGQALGTVGYMSPEQIRGGKVDHRSDIFSFGCVLYECVTGQRAFLANTDVETLHQILHEDPTQVQELNPSAPDALRRLIKRCLARNPDRRLQSMRDLAIELQEIVDEYDTLPVSSGSTPAEVSGGHPTVGRRRIPPVIFGLVAVVGIVVLVLGVNELLRRPGSEPSGMSSSPHPSVTGILSDIQQCALSPDGKYLAYAAGPGGSQGLWIHQLATGSDVELSAAVHGQIGFISFSPDGSYVYFGAPSAPDNSGYWAIYQIPSLGGGPRRILFDVDSKLSFSPDGRQACFRRGLNGGESTALVVVDLETGKERILSAAAGFTFKSPSWSPSGKRIAAIQSSGQLDTLLVIDAVTGDYEPLGQVWTWATSCAWLPQDLGVILTGQQTSDESNQVWHVGYPDGAVRRLTGGEASYDGVTTTADGSTLAVQRSTLLKNLWSAPLTEEPAPQKISKGSALAGGMGLGFGVVDDGSIVVAWDGQLRLLDRQGVYLSSITNTPGLRSFRPMGVPGGGILFSRAAPGEYPHIWHADLASGATTQLTSGPGEFHLFGTVPTEEFLYGVRNNQKEVFIGSVGEREHRNIPGYMPCSISPDGRRVFTTERQGPGRPPRIVVRSMDTLEPQHEFNSGAHPTWTPEGDAVAHVINTNEGQQIVLQPLDGEEPKIFMEITPPRLDMGSGQAYCWSRDGKHLCLRFREDGVSNLWIASSAGGELRPITDFRTGGIDEWEWALDSQSVYFIWENAEYDAVLIRDFE